MEKSFEELWEEIWRELHLPREAKDLIPKSLSKATKEKLLRSEYEPRRIAGILEKAVDEINRGSIEPLDTLVSKRL